MEVTGAGMSLAYSSSNTTFASVLRIMETPKMSAAKIDTSAITDTAATSQPSSRPDYGNLKAAIKYNKTMANTILGWASNRTVQPFQLTVTDGTTSSVMGFTGWLQEFDPLGGTIEVEKMCEAQINIKLTGPYTIA